MRVSGKHTTNILTPIDDSFVLLSQNHDTLATSMTIGASLATKLTGFMPYMLTPLRPPKSVILPQIAHVQSSIVNPTSSDTSDHPTIFNEFLKWYKDH